LRIILSYMYMCAFHLLGILETVQCAVLLTLHHDTVRPILWSGFQLSVESDWSLLWFCLTLLCDWFRKLAPHPPPIRNKTAFSRAWPLIYVHVFASNSDWFIWLSVFLWLAE